VTDPFPPSARAVIAGLFADPAAADALPWQFFRDGIDIHWLVGAPDGGPASALLRYRPGAGVTLHRHAGAEHVLILHGSQSDKHGRYFAGTLVINPAGTVHDVTSEEGCLALLIWEKLPEVLG
jgi:anti-sigma factor ChrR (cupin superfamily)